MKTTRQHYEATCPSTEQLAECLEPLAQPESTMLEHIACCKDCQHILDWLAGNEEFWQDAQQSLSSTKYDHNRYTATTQLVESICALSSGEVADFHDPLCKHETQQLTSLLEPASHPELLGRIGRYELEQLVGRGGMGLVFRAYDTELYRVVAVKTLAIHLVPIGDARERFVREGRACASLMHPHIVPVHDVITDGPVPTLVMQYVAGPSLEQWLQKNGPMPWQQALSLLRQITEALIVAHENGFVHRDIKPGNVLLEADASRALLTDFGLVRTLDDATLTRSGMLAGTPDYMSPEQSRGEAVGQASDLFSLGSLFYAMLTGVPPFRAVEPMAVMNRICHEPHQSVMQERPEVPVGIAAIVDALLEKDQRKRIGTAVRLRDELSACLHEQSVVNLAERRNAARVVRPPVLWFGGLVLALIVGLSLFNAFRPGAGSNALPAPSVGEVDMQTLKQLGDEYLNDGQSGKRFDNLAGYSPELDAQIARLADEVTRLVEDYQATGQSEITAILEEQEIETELAELWLDLEQLQSELR